MGDRYDTLAHWLAFEATTFRMHDYHHRLLMRYLRCTRTVRERFAPPSWGLLGSLAGYGLIADPNVPRHQAWVLGDVTVNSRPTVLVNGMDFERVPNA